MEQVLISLLIFCGQYEKNENKALQCKQELVNCYIQAQERNYIQGKETCIKNYIRK